MMNGLNFPPIAQKSRFATDFSDYGLGNELTDGWTKRSSSGSIGALVDVLAGSVGGRAVTISNPTVQVRAVTWKFIQSSATDTEILALIKWGSAGTNGGSGLMARGASDAQAGYTAVQHGTATATNGAFEVAEVVAGSYAGHNQSVKVPTAGTRYWVRFQCIGTTIRGRMWAFGTAEPATWDSTDTDATLATGFGGLMVVDTSPSFVCEFFSVGLDGKTAPFPNG